jgi:hypothetical protein
VAVTGNGVGVVFGFDAVVLGIFLLWTLVTGWVIFLGGAEWAEDSWCGDFILGILFDVPAATLAMVVKVLVGVLWCGTVVLVLLL